jgi:large subunit ribosomal protein L3
MAGQLGLFTRIQYNSKIIKIGNISKENINPKQGWRHYGNIKNEYLIIQGSVPGPAKRQLLITRTLRPTRSQVKKKYEFVRLY